MSERTALVLGGTGMLKGCADELVARGWRVVLPSRRPDGALGSAAKASLRGRNHLPQGIAGRPLAGPPAAGRRVPGRPVQGRPAAEEPAAGGSAGGSPGARALDDRSSEGRSSDGRPLEDLPLQGRRIAVAADWARPGELADRVREVVDRPADLLVAWVHASYRDAVLRAVAPLLAPRAPVVEVHDSGAIHPVRGVPDPALEGHPTQQVVLGFVRHGGSTRWLSHEETSVGVLDAVHRALDGRPPSVHQVGEVDTWVMRH